MHTRFGHAALRTLVQTRISSVSRRFTIPPRMDSHAEDRPLWKAFSRNAIFECLRGTLHLNYPDERLAFLIAHQSVPFFVQGNEVHLEVGGVGDGANDHPGKNPVHTSVIHRVRMMSIRRRCQKRRRQDHDEYRNYPRYRGCNFLDMHCQSSSATRAHLKPRSSFCLGRSMSFSKYSSQIFAHGRSSISGTRYSMTCPGATGVAYPLIG